MRTYDDNLAEAKVHWEIGKLLDERKVDSKHGDSIVKRLSIDLKTKYPDMGLSPRNLWNMKRFYLRYCQYDTKVQQAVAVLPWSHNLLLMSYDLSPENIVFYANEVFRAIEGIGVGTSPCSEDYDLYNGIG